MAYITYQQAVAVAAQLTQAWAVGEQFETRSDDSRKTALLAAYAHFLTELTQSERPDGGYNIKGWG